MNEIIDPAIYKSYRGNSLLKGVGEQIAWTQPLVQEYIKCSKDPIYFIENYVKIVHLDRGLVPFKMYDYQKEIVRNAYEGRFLIVATSRQVGKALSLDTPILTPDGYQNLEDLHIGDVIYSQDGTETKITFETPIMYDHDCYQIEFAHGEIITADADHLWTVEIRKRKTQIKTLTTKELFPLLKERQSNGQSIKIKCPDPIQFSKQEIPLDPYLLGLWLGDGHSDSGRITCHTEDWNEYSKENFSSSVKEYSRNIKTVRFENLTKTLRIMNLIKNKHIPKEYIHNSIEVRLALIQGMMDTDGSVNHSGAFEFYQKNYKSIEEFRYLLSTLGVKSSIRSKIINGETHFTVGFCNRNFNWFRLTRKLQKTKERSVCNAEKNYYFYIKSIEKVESVPVKCIQVDHLSHLFLAGKTLIPTHNSTVMTAFILWYILFNADKTVALLANKAETAIEILGRVHTSYQNLPKWLQQGVVTWNKKTIELENGSKIIAAATSSSAIRGYSINLLFLDEVAFVENWDHFESSVLPTISSSLESRIIMVSTPNGLNHFYKYWVDANNGRNGYRHIKVNWNEVPGRDQNWYDTTLSSMSGNLDKFNQEFGVEFLGSTDTLIAGWKLNELVHQTPIHYKDGLSKYIEPIKIQKVANPKSLGRQMTTNEGHRYVITVDTSEGKGFDYSTFHVTDITEMPYQQCATFRSNLITPVEFAQIIHNTAKTYNNAMVLIEANSLGPQVADVLYDDFEYENVLFTESAGSKGKRVSNGSGKMLEKGIKMSIPVKSLGCSLLKLLIEQNQYIINDFHTIEELSRFSRKNKSFAAEDGYHDDMVMALVVFAWLTDQQYFRDMTDINTLQKLRDRSSEMVEDALSPFGFFTRDEQDHFVDEDYKPSGDHSWFKQNEKGEDEPQWTWQDPSTWPHNF